MKKTIKVATITYHFPFNSGAALQTVALQKSIKKLGYKVEIINYRPWYHQNRYTPQKKYEIEKIMKRDDVDDLKEAKKQYKLVQKNNKSKKKRAAVISKKFTHFVNRYMNTTKVYRTMDDLCKAHFDYDIIFCGSDQLWNISLTDGELDQAYFANFAPKSIRCTYAIGINLPENHNIVNQLEKLGDGLECISMRETKYMRLVNIALPNVPIRQDIDPTLLLQAYEYHEFEARETCLPYGVGQYVLTYTMGDITQKSVYNLAILIGEKYNLPVIDITGNPNRPNEIFGVKSVTAGPDEFLTFIKNARFIITNSFHGTAFSVIYNKNFVVFPHSSTGNRVTDLLDRLGLGDRYGGDTEKLEKQLTILPNYKCVEKKLVDLRTESLDYIKKMCEKK